MKKLEMIVVVVPYRVGIYLDRKLLMQSDSGFTCWQTIKDLAGQKVLKIVKCDYWGILPEDLDRVTVPIFRKVNGQKKIIGYRKAVP